MHSEVHISMWSNNAYLWVNGNVTWSKTLVEKPPLSSINDLKWEDEDNHQLFATSGTKLSFLWKMWSSSRVAGRKMKNVARFAVFG